MSSPTSKDLSYIPPDGGYGWVVVFGASLSVGFAYSFPKVLTIYYNELQTVFNISYSQVAWVSSIMCSTTYGGGEWDVTISFFLGFSIVRVNLIMQNKI